MKRPFIALAIVAASVSSSNVFSQSAATKHFSSYAKIIPPSPNVAAMEKFGNTSVSHYTGVPDISLPLYQIVSRDITVPISLSYHAGGIRVSEEASRVGLGWSLQAGGVISRHIINIDDFLVSSSAFLSSLNQSPELKQNPEYVATQEVFYGTQIKLMRTSDHELESFDLGDYAKITEFDFEPDNFNYSFPGHSGKFILTREREAMLMKKEKIDIRVIGDYADRWEIRTADGYKYEFAEYETVKGEDQVAHRSAWYLTKIVSPKGAEVIFNYTNQPQQYIQPQGEYFEMISPYKQTPCSAIECQATPPIKESIQGKRSPTFI